MIHTAFCLHERASDGTLLKFFFIVSLKTDKVNSYSDKIAKAN